MNSLESIVGDHDPLDGRLEASQTDEEVIFIWENRSFLITKKKNKKYTHYIARIIESANNRLEIILFTCVDAHFWTVVWSGIPYQRIAKNWGSPVCFKRPFFQKPWFSSNFSGTDIFNLCIMLLINLFEWVLAHHLFWQNLP